MVPVVMEPKKPGRCRKHTIRELEAIRRRIERKPEEQPLRFAEAWIVSRCANCRACVPR
ncbi:MAG: hypothetical protein KA105_02615 [Caulobacter sp.]|nr:hypothetical protein [Caulobacter sp.]